MIAGRRSGLKLRRRRRPRSRGRRIGALAAFAAVAAVVIGEVAADVVNSAAPASEVAGRSYAAAVVPIIMESTALRLWLTDVRLHAVALGRLGLETALGRLVAGTDNLQVQLRALGLAPPDPRSARLFSDVLAARASAARLVMGGVVLATGPSRDVTGATAVLVRAAQQLTASDSDYSHFVSSLPPYVRRSVPMPSSRWYSPSQWSTGALASFATLISSSPGLRIHNSLVIVAISVQPPALRIVGLPAAPASRRTGPRSASAKSTTSSSTASTTPPADTGSTLAPPTSSSTTPTTSIPPTTTTLQVPPAGSVSCLQPTNRLRVDVVVANAGNVTAFNVEVSAALAGPISSPGGSAKDGKNNRVGRQVAPPSCYQAEGAASSTASNSTQSAQDASGRPGSAVGRDIAVLAGGGSDYVSLPPMAVRFGSSYLLTVRVGNQRESVMLQVASG